MFPAFFRPLPKKTEYLLTLIVPFLIQYYVMEYLINVLLILYMCFIYFWNLSVFHSLYKAMCIYSVFCVLNWSAIYKNIRVSNMGVTHVKWAILGILFAFSTPLYRRCRGATDGRSDTPGPQVDIHISVTKLLLRKWPPSVFLLSVNDYHPKASRHIHSVMIHSLLIWRQINLFCGNKYI